MPAAELEEVGTGHVFVQRHAFDAVGEEVASVLPFAVESGDFATAGRLPPKIA